MNILDIINEIRGYRKAKSRDPHVIVVDTTTLLKLIDDLRDIQVFQGERNDNYLKVGGIIVVDRKDVLDAEKSAKLKIV